MFGNADAAGGYLPVIVTRRIGSSVRWARDYVQIFGFEWQAAQIGELPVVDRIQDAIISGVVDIDNQVVGISWIAGYKIDIDLIFVCQGVTVYGKISGPMKWGFRAAAVSRIKGEVDILIGEIRIDIDDQAKAGKVTVIIEIAS